MKFKRTTVITIGLLAFLGGLGFARTKWLVSYEIIASLIILWLVTVLRLKWLAILSTLLLGFVLGWWRGQVYLEKLKPLAELNNVKASGVVIATSDAAYNSRGQLSFDAENLNLSEPYKAQLPGRLIISGFGAPAVFKGDQVAITGKFYAARGSHQLGMSFADIQVVGQGGSKIDDIRRNFTAGLQSAVPEPEASFGMGLLIGQRSNLPTVITNQLAAVGLTHIIAVSGYNLMIILRAVRRLLLKRSKYQTAVLSLVLIVLFLLMTGMSASIVRAAMVSVLSIGAWYYGRAFKPLLLIALTAAVTAGINPLYIWSDIGWYLSFLAFFGVLILSPLLNQRLFRSSELSTLPALLSESFSALVMTVPLIMYTFNQVSLVALPANLLLVPLVPMAMLFSLVAGIAGALVPSVAGLLAWPATMLMTFMLDTIQLLARVPHALAHRTLSLLGMIIFYVSILLFVGILGLKSKRRYAKITDMKVVF